MCIIHVSSIKICGNHCSDAQIFYIILIFCKPMPTFVARPNIKFCHIHVISFIVFPHEKLERNHIHFSCKCTAQTKLDVWPIEYRFNANQFCSWREAFRPTYYTLRLYQLKKPIHDIYIFFKKQPSSTFIFMMTQFSFTSLMSKTSISIPTYF